MWVGTFGVFVALSFGVPANGSSMKSDPTPLADHEQHLAPYMDNLVSYRDNPIAKRFISLTNLVDVVPTWLIDLFVPLLIPESTLDMGGLKLEIPLPDPTHLFPGIPPNAAHLEVNRVSVDKLNEFKKLKPAKFQEGTRFTWAGQVSWKETAQTTLKLGAKLVILNRLNVDVNLTFTVNDPAVDFAAIVAFDREKMCGVWGHVLQSSLGCAVWPLFVDADAGVSGVNFSHLVLHASDFSLESLDIGGLPFGLGHKVSKFISKVIEDKKPSILENMSGSVSEQARKAGNVGMLAELPAFHRYYPCSIDELEPKHVDVSTVCFTNRAAFAMNWGYANCPTHKVSHSSKTFPVGQTQCMRVQDIWSDAKEGQVLRSQVEAVAGLHEIIDPALVYKPNSNVAAFECTGTTLIYKCKLISVAPEDHSKATPASTICLLNRGGYTMHFDVKDQRTGEWVGRSDDFPLGQKQCADLSAMNEIQEGDQFKIVAHANGGKDTETDRSVTFQKNGPTVTYECTGTTLSIKCNLFSGEVMV